MSTQNKKAALLDERSRLHAELNYQNGDTIIPLLKENERQLKALERAAMLERVNGKYARLRELARQAYECEQPTEDITTSDGSFHKTKVKKYPKIAALEYAYGLFKDGLLQEIRINGEKFQMYSTKYEYNKPDEHTRPATFAEFLELNSIPQADITEQQYTELCDKLNALNTELRANIEKYKAGLNALDVHLFNYWGLIGQSNMHLYEYTPNN